MSAWSDHDYRDDRAEALGEARSYYGHPEPCDDAFWLGVNVGADAMARTTDAALAAVDSVIGLLPSSTSVEGEPRGTDPSSGGRVDIKPSSPSASPEGLTPVRVRRRGFA